MGNPSDQLAALIAVYQADRQHSLALMANSLTIVGGVVAYMALAVTVLSTKAALAGGWLTPLIVAFPPWIGVGFHLIMFTTTVRLANSMLFLETKIAKDHAQLSWRQRSLVGAAAAELATDVEKQSGLLRFQTGVTYLGLITCVLVFTGGNLLLALSRAEDIQLIGVAIACSLYLALAAATAQGWLQALRIFASEYPPADPRPDAL